MTSTRTIHPLAELFPEIKGDDFDSLVKDIRTNGLIHAIVVDHDVILDGRNRLCACKEAEVEPKYIEFETLGQKCSPEDYIWSANVSRRHLTDDQRSVLASRWADTIRKMAKDRSNGNLKVGNQNPEREDSPARAMGGNHPTRMAIAERAQVSEHKAKQAEIVHKKAPELEEPIIAGKVRLKDAVKVARGKTNTSRRPTSLTEHSGDKVVLVLPKSNRHRRRVGVLATELIALIEELKISMSLTDTDGASVIIEFKNRRPQLRWPKAQS